MKNFRNIQVEESNLLSWQGLIVPVSSSRRDRVPLPPSPPYKRCALFQDNPPYDKGAFRIEIIFPTEYPFKPPKITFKTKIYHPNIDEKGQVCLPVISAENWKPATKTDQGGYARRPSARGRRGGRGRANAVCLAVFCSNSVAHRAGERPAARTPAEGRLSRRILKRPKKVLEERRGVYKETWRKAANGLST